MIHIPERDLELLDELIKMKKYPSRAEAIRIAIKDLLWEEHPAYKNYRLLFKHKNKSRDV